MEIGYHQKPQLANPMLTYIKKLLTPDKRLPDNYYGDKQHTQNVFRYIQYIRRRQVWLMKAYLDTER